MARDRSEEPIDDDRRQRLRKGNVLFGRNLLISKEQHAVFTQLGEDRSSDVGRKGDGQVHTGHERTHGAIGRCEDGMGHDAI
jgi:hypothetical protein